VVVLVLSGTVAALTLTGTSAPTAVALEPLATPGANPFMPPVGIDQPGISPPKGSGGTFSGGTPGLYGGTLRQGSCDPRQMVAFLSAHPDKSAAWATVLGIRPADIAGYVASLAPVVLRSDVAVTNHGFTGGHVTSFPAVLQAGTAVLVDRYGSPVTKCFCGNPLTKPTAYSRPTYTGTRWPSFALGGITIIQQTTVTIDSFTLVDPATGASFRRPSGSTGSADQPGPAPKPATITTVAGNGSNSFCGDGGPATQACLEYPMGLAVDAAGNLYIADRSNSRVRLVATPDGQPSPTTSTTPTPKAGGSPTPTSSPTPAQQVAVPGTQPWTDTGIYLSEASVSFTASGTVNIYAGRADSNKTPDGTGPVHPNCIASPAIFGGQWIAMGLPCWSLIGRIGSGPPFEVGAKATHAVPSPGELYLGVNDESVGSFADNSGEWTVQVSRSP